MFDDGFDSAIDEIARQMTDGEPPADFKARILARIESDGDRRGRWRIVCVQSLAVAAVIFVVLIARAPWRSDVPRVATDVRLDPEARPVQEMPEATDRRPPVAAEIRLVVPRRTDAAYREAMGSPAVSELRPAPLDIEPLHAETIASADLEPAGMDALESVEVPALTLAPLKVPAIGVQ